MSRKLPNYDASNRLAARIILADVEKYGGESGLMCRHSRAVMARLSGGKPARPARDGTGQLRLDLERAA